MDQALTFLSSHNHEELAYRFDKKTGLRAFIAVHNTNRGPGLGGTRLWKYTNMESALLDVLRLSEGMTYKAAVAGLALGGGKSVIMADGQEKDPAVRAARFEAFGRFVEEIDGRYIAAEDVGTQPQDMTYIRHFTNHVVGMPVSEGGSGDPSPMTAFGVMRGIEALVEAVLNKDSLAGVRINIQGLGKVGLSLARSLVKAGAIVTGSDVSSVAIKEAREAGVQIVEPPEIYDLPCDIFSPCALGAVINDRTIPRLKCKIVAGCANNQLEESRHGEALEQRGIVYAVDYVINSGGLINVAAEFEGYDEIRARAKTSEIYTTIKRMLSIARTEKVSTVEAARIMAEEALHVMAV